VRQRAADLTAPLGIPAYRRLWSADVISSLGDWAGRLALAVLVFERTGSPAWAAAVTAVSLAGFVGLGQVLATFGDRHGRVSVMLVTDVVRAACFLAMLIPGIPMGGLLALAFVAGLASPPFEAARAAALPDLVPEARYGEALALSGMTFQFSLVAGYAFGGVLLGVVTPSGALAVNAGTFLVSAAILLSLRSSPAAAPATEQTSAVASLRTAARHLLGDRMIRRAIALVAVTGCLGTVSEALVVPYAGAVGFGSSATGLLAAMVPVGTLLAVAVIPTRGSHERLLRGASWCVLLSAAAAAPLFAMEASGALALLAFAVSGAMYATSIPTNAVAGMRLQRDTRASAMGIAVGLIMGSQALGAAGGGIAAATFGTSTAITWSFLLAAAFGAWAVATSPRDARHLAPRRRPAAADGEGREVIDLREPEVIDLREPEVIDLDAATEPAPQEHTFVATGSA
jgi:MFS family permease